MNKKKILVIIVIIIIIILIINAIFLNMKDRPEIKDISENITTENYEISVSDYYEADYLWIEAVNHKFDKYLAADISIKNISDEKQKIMTLGHFYIDDGNYKLKSALIDENHKKFGKELYPDDTFDITLTFPVDYANQYVLYYNETLKEEDNKKLGFKLDGTDLEKKKVERSVEHFNPLEKAENEEEEVAAEVVDEEEDQIIEEATGQSSDDQLKEVN